MPLYKCRLVEHGLVKAEYIIEDQDENTIRENFENFDHRSGDWEILPMDDVVKSQEDL